MRKSAWKYVLWLLCLAVAISALQYLWIWGASWRADVIYKGRLEALSEQRAVHLTIKATDQFGKPASNFKVAVKIASISWYFRIFPLWAEHHPTYYLETDQIGIAKLNLWFRKAYEVEFKEVSTNRYIFPEGKLDPHVRSFNNNPGSSFAISNLDRIGQIIDMKVLRHGPPVKLAWYRPRVPGQGPIGMSSPGIRARDEMVFTVDIMGNKFLEGRHAGDLIITVKNAKTACQMFTKRYTPGLDFKQKGEWNVSCEALNGTVIQQAVSRQIITFAPETGYKKRLNYRLTIKKEMSKAESAESYSSGGELFKLVRSVPDEDDYISIGPKEGFGARLYLRHDSPRWYGEVSISFDLRYRESKLLIGADGAYNTTGSNNLWYVIHGHIGLL